MFLEELSGLPIEREIEFTIDLVSGIRPISQAPYCITPTKVKEIKV